MVLLLPDLFSNEAIVIVKFDDMSDSRQVFLLITTNSFNHFRIEGCWIYLLQLKHMTIMKLNKTVSFAMLNDPRMTHNSWNFNPTLSSS